MKQNTSRASTEPSFRPRGGILSHSNHPDRVLWCRALEVVRCWSVPASSTNAPYLKLGNTYATFLTLYYLDENEKSVERIYDVRWNVFVLRLQL